jgi:hypothetical protein
MPSSSPAIVKIPEFKSIYDIEEKMINDLNTCQVLCFYCHTKLHNVVEFFKKYKNEIIEKSLNLKEKQSKLNRELIKKMYFEDKIKQIDIAKYFNASPGTISDIIIEFKSKILI